MIALQPKPRLTGVRTARNAAVRRRKRIAVRKQSVFTQIVAAIVVIVVMLMFYLWLMARLTSTSYALDRATEQRLALQYQTQQLDERLSQLRSEDRLASLAAQLGMTEPQRFAIVQLPARVPPGAPGAQRKIALLSTVAGWLRSTR